MPTTSTFEALADSTRLHIVELLAEREHTAGELAAQFQISRPAVSRHLRVLREADLIQWRSEAQRRHYTLNPATIDHASEWLTTIRERWSQRLDALARYLDEHPQQPHQQAQHAPDGPKGTQP